LAYYVGTSLDADTLAGFVAAILGRAGVAPVVAGLPAGVETVRRSGDNGSWTFIINHTRDEVEVPVSGVELLSGADVAKSLTVQAGKVAVVRH
jgi:beta-galactosidase